MFLMGIFWYHLYDMSNYKLCNLDTYNHNFGSSVEPKAGELDLFKAEGGKKVHNELRIVEVEFLETLNQ